MTALQPVIQRRILALREQRVMPDADLAQFYGVETRVLVQAVKRNLARFPEDFMFQLSAEEFANWQSQSVIRVPAGGRSTAPYSFAEQAWPCCSSMLGGPRAIAVNMRDRARPSCACGRQDLSRSHRSRALRRLSKGSTSRPSSLDADLRRPKAAHA